MGVFRQRRGSGSWSFLFLTSLLSFVPAIRGDYSSDLESIYSDFIPTEEILDKRSFYPFSSLYAPRGLHVNDDYFNEAIRHKGQVSTRSRSFIGKKSYAKPTDQILEFTDKKEYPNVFYRMLEKPVFQAISRLDGHDVVKRSPGTFSHQSSPDSGLSQDKRRSFIGKRNSADMEKRRSFIGKRDGIDDASLSSQVDRLSDILEDKRRSFIGKRDNFELKNKRRSFIGKRDNFEQKDKRRSFIGKRTHASSGSLPENLDYGDFISAGKRRSFIGKRFSKEQTPRLSSVAEHPLTYKLFRGDSEAELALLGDSIAGSGEKRRSFIGKRTDNDVSSTNQLMQDLNPSLHPNVNPGNNRSIVDNRNSNNGLSQIEKRRSFIGKRVHSNEEEKRRSFIGKRISSINEEKRRSFIGK